METVREQISDFLNKCEEIKNCKFIMATTKIKDLLKSIVNSQELYELFNTVTANFDYIAAKQKYFIDADNGVYGNCRVALPDTIGDRLAFIFCMLVEFDRNDINFNLFLQKYYPKDGSYYASYHLFCDEVIASLENIICDIFAKELQQPPLEKSEPVQKISAPENVSAPESYVAPQINAKAAEALNTIYMLADGEIAQVQGSLLTEDEKDAATSMLSGIKEAARRNECELLKSITCGYNYFVMCSKFETETLGALFEAIGEYISAL